MQQLDVKKLSHMEEFIKCMQIALQIIFHNQQTIKHDDTLYK